MLLAVLFFSCNSEKREVERIAQAYLDAETNFRIAEARPYVAGEDMTYALDFMEKFVLPNISKELLDSLTPNEVTIKNTELFGDTAIVSFHSKNLKNESDAQILMVRNDTTWLVIQQGEKVSRTPKPQPEAESVVPQEQAAAPADTTAKK